jgi:hypothetical protein
MPMIQERYSQLLGKVERAAQMVDGDANASDVLKAVVAEFRKKADKGLRMLESSPSDRVREIIIEVEQAADSAKVAAQADRGASEDTRRTVQEAHDPICALKREMMEGRI